MRLRPQAARRATWFSLAAAKDPVWCGVVRVATWLVCGWLATHDPTNRLLPKQHVALRVLGENPTGC
jgi:hypothetical protein